MNTLSHKLCRVSNLLTNTLSFLAPLFALGIRLYITKGYLWSGWLKLRDWQGTLNLFEYEYQVPFLSPEFAAYLGTGVEIIFSILFVLGLGARIPALVLFATSVVMTISYPLLMTPEGACMIKDHYLWGALLLVIVFYGHGKLSLDYLIQKKLCKDYKY